MREDISQLPKRGRGQESDKATLGIKSRDDTIITGHERTTTTNAHVSIPRRSNILAHELALPSIDSTILTALQHSH